MEIGCSEKVLQSNFIMWSSFFILNLSHHHLGVHGIRHWKWYQWKNTGTYTALITDTAVAFCSIQKALLIPFTKITIETTISLYANINLIPRPPCKLFCSLVCAHYMNANRRTKNGGGMRVRLHQHASFVILCIWWRHMKKHYVIICGLDPMWKSLIDRLNPILPTPLSLQSSDSYTINETDYNGTCTAYKPSLPPEQSSIL